MKIKIDKIIFSIFTLVVSVGCLYIGFQEMRAGNTGFSVTLIALSLTLVFVSLYLFTSSWEGQ